jgi:hypothetical protein
VCVLSVSFIGGRGREGDDELTGESGGKRGSMEAMAVGLGSVGRVVRCDRTSQKQQKRQE